MGCSFNKPLLGSVESTAPGTAPVPFSGPDSSKAEVAEVMLQLNENQVIKTPLYSSNQQQINKPMETLFLISHEAFRQAIYFVLTPLIVKQEIHSFETSWKEFQRADTFRHFLEEELLLQLEGRSLNVVAASEGVHNVQMIESDLLKNRINKDAFETWKDNYLFQLSDIETAMTSMFAQLCTSQEEVIQTIRARAINPAWIANAEEFAVCVTWTSSMLSQYGTSSFGSADESVVLYLRILHALLSSEQWPQVFQELKYAVTSIQLRQIEEVTIDIGAKEIE